MNKTTDKLLDAAENRIRTGGFHAVSFRDLAEDLGIKSASVHYHFPKKEDLGVAVVERYHKRFFAMIDSMVESGQDRLSAFLAGYRAALRSVNKACLCGIMGAEAQGLPSEVQDVVRKFLDANVDWLEATFRNQNPETAHDRAVYTVATLQGAMMLSINLDDIGTFDRVAAQVLSPQQSAD